MKRSQKIREKQGKPCGESSPYWNYVGEASLDGVTRAQEWPSGNPDVLAEEEALWSHDLSEVEQEKLETIREGLSRLAPQERAVVLMCAYSNLSYEQAARRLKISKETAYQAILRARKKLKKFHAIRMAQSGLYSRPYIGEK